MTDEEMAEEYENAQDYCSLLDVLLEEQYNQDYGGLSCYISPYIEQAYLAGLKAGRPQWHDLREDPNDLPKDITSLYLVRVYSWDFGLSHLYKKYGMYIPTVCEWSGEYFKALNDMAYSNARNIKSCIAWCEIPTFDKE
jgi:hypothetical protein